MYFIAGLLMTSLITAVIIGTKKESFQNTPVIFTSQPLIDNYWLIRNYPGAIFRYLGTKEYTGILDMREINFDGVGDLYIVADPYLAQKYSINGEKVMESPSAYFVRIGLPEIFTKEYNCGFNLLNKKVGYIDECDRNFIRGICAAYHIPENLVKWYQIPVQDWGNLRKLIKREGLDVIITHLIPYSEMHLLLLDQPIVIDGFKGIDVERMRVLYSWAKAEELDIKKFRLPGSGLLVGSGLVFKMQKGLYRLENPRTEKFIGYKEDAESADMDYKCYGDLTITRKIACNSPYDVMGYPKYKHTSWDKPCIIDEDCPFFTGERGGCKSSGICELPIGVERIGFRKYNAKGLRRPLCYGPLGECGTDYAFAGDGREYEMLI